MGFREFCRQWNFRWKMLTWWDILKVSMDETITMTRYSALPSLFCVGLEVFGYDDLMFLFILSIVAAYFAHKRQTPLGTSGLSGLLSPLALVRYITFFLIIVKCTWLIPYVRYPKKFEDFDELPYRFIGCHAKGCINVVLFRLYLTCCGAITKSVKNKYQPNHCIKTNSPSSPKQVPPQDGEAEGENGKVVAE